MSTTQTDRILATEEILVHAPVATVWALQTDVESWPAWQPPVTSARRLDDGPVRPGSRFRWTTPLPESPLGPASTLVVTSSVDEVEHHRLLRWHGPAEAAGLRIDEGVHVWTFTELDGGTLVRTEEAWRGTQIEAHAEIATAALAASLTEWLVRLKDAAEAGR